MRSASSYASPKTLLDPIVGMCMPLLECPVRSPESRRPLGGGVYPVYHLEVEQTAARCSERCLEPPLDGRICIPPDCRLVSLYLSGPARMRRCRKMVRCILRARRRRHHTSRHPCQSPRRTQSSLAGTPFFACGGPLLPRQPEDRAGRRTVRLKDYMFDVEILPIGGR